jgi:3-dehydroquinate synthase
MIVTVEVSPPYSVVIEPGLIARAWQHIAENRLALVSDEQVAALYGNALQQALEQAGKRVTRYTVPPGEASKSLARFEILLRQLARDGFDRRSAVLALGGGVVGDLAGFVAASYMRGVAFYQLPTSLLAMVDASVGGKTGVNLPEGKNLIGAFWQPRAVLIDPEVLATLSEREFKGGAVELFKHGLLAAPGLLDDVLSPAFHPGGDSAWLGRLIARSVEVKARIVAHDEREAGERAHLNLGHTLAHALEAASQHALTHGDAVAYGLLYAGLLAAQRGCTDETVRYEALLRWLEPAPLPVQDWEALQPYLQRDKKHHSRRQRWVLLKRLGEPFIADDLTPAELERAWAECLQRIRALGLLQ